MAQGVVGKVHEGLLDEAGIALRHKRIGGMHHQAHAGLFGAWAHTVCGGGEHVG